MTEQEIKKLVMEKYPITDLERQGCVIEKHFRKMMRKEYTAKLNEQNTTTGIQR
jgi:hypothetical protein